MRQPDELDRLWRRFADSANSPLRERLPVTAGAALVVGACCAALLLAPRFVLTDMPLDALIPLDGALRYSHGQRAHLDFYTPLGDVYYWMLAAGAWLTGPLDPRLLAATNALAGLLALGATWLAVRDRLSEPLRAGVLVAIPLLALSPRTLDSMGLIGFNAMYNRWGWALALLVSVVALLPSRAPRSPLRRAAEIALVAGAVLASFWIKVTFTAVVAGIALLGLLVPANRLVAAVGLGLGAVLVGASLLTPVGGAYLADLAIAAEASAGGPGLLRGDQLFQALEVNRAGLVLAICLAFGLLRTAQGEDQQADAGRIALIILALMVGGVLVASQNNDVTVPLLMVPALLTAAALHRRGDARLTPAASALALLWMAWPLHLDARAVLTYFSASFGPSLPTVEEPASPLHRLRIPDLAPGDRLVQKVLDGEIAGDIYDNLIGVAWHVDNPVILSDALDLLTAHDLRDRRVASLTFSPLFPYALGSVPPRGLPAWWDYGRTFGPSWDQRACAALADSEVVLEPRVWLIEGLVDENRPCLEAEFTPLAESPLWVLWVRAR